MSEETLSTRLFVMADNLTETEAELNYLALAIGASNLNGAAGAASLLFGIAARIGDTALLAREAMTKAEKQEERQAP